MSAVLSVFSGLIGALFVAERWPAEAAAGLRNALRGMIGGIVAWALMAASAMIAHSLPGVMGIVLMGAVGGGIVAWMLTKIGSVRNLAAAGERARYRIPSTSSIS